MQRVLIIGGGLAGSLVAARFVERRPELELVLLERGASLLGDKTWCFHAADLAPISRHGVRLDPGFLQELASSSWDGYDVEFPQLSRTVPEAYYAIRAADLRVKLLPRLGSRVRTGVEVRRLSAREVELASGERLGADLVVDTRGNEASGTAENLAWQTFFGVFLRSERPHGILRPKLMDATMPQLGGYRFLYVLPFGPRELLVEDTRYVEDRAIDEAGARAFLPQYLRRIAGTAGAWEELGTERGSLPIPLAGRAAPALLPGIAPAGVGAGMYHPTTGYSLRYAALAAELLSTAPTGEMAVARMRTEAERTWKAGAFYRRLNNMLFKAAAPEERWRVLEKFYRLGDRTVGRFYAGRSTWIDRARLLSGRPPVAPMAGLKAFLGTARA